VNAAHRATMLVASIALAALSIGCGSSVTPRPSVSAAALTAGPAASAAHVASPMTPTASPSASSSGTGRASVLGGYPPLPTAAVPAAMGARLQGVLDGVLRLHSGISSPSPGGITAAVIAPTCGTWAGAAGHRAPALPMTADTQFMIASATKNVTAASVLRLVEEGRVDLNDPIATYLPAGLTVDTNGATVRQVLQMRSGIGEIDEDTLVRLALRQPGVALDRATVVRTITKPTAAPGTVTEYVDANYILLAYVIERGSGTSLAKAIRTLVLGDAGLQRLVLEDEDRPQGPLALGMVDTSYRTQSGLQETLGQALATGYIPTRSLASIVSTAGSMVSDAPTLARWGYLLLGGSVVSASSLGLMTTFDPGTIPYGMGTHDLSWPFGIDGIGHAGWWMGYRAVLLTRPSTGVTVAALSSDERLDGFWSVAGAMADLAETC